MAFFDELSRTLSDKGKEAAQKARDGASVLQMKMQIASEKGKLKELYGAVGAVYYKKHRDDEDTEFGDRQCADQCCGSGGEGPEDGGRPGVSKL